jgi:CAAX protease family protein
MEASRHPPSNVTNETSVTEQSELRPLGFWATLVLVAVAIFAANFLDHFFVSIWRNALSGTSLPSKEALTGFHLILSSAFQVAILSAIVRISGVPYREYLGLTLPRARHALMGVACIISLLIIVHGWMFLLKGSISPLVIDMYRAAQNAGTLPLLWIAIVIAAPTVEEITFRGFVFAGWSQTRLGVGGAIVASSLVWTLTHGLVGWAYIFGIFCLGLIFGWLRWHSGSTILIIVLHAMVNFVVMYDVSVVVSRMAG